MVNSLLGNNGANALDGEAAPTSCAASSATTSTIVDNAGDHAIELTNQGIDTVRTTVSFTLASGMSIETLRVFNPAATNAVNLNGNQLVNTLIGNAGLNALDGKAGADTMNGLGGNDSYVVDVAGDKVIEGADQGSDNVRTSVSYALASGSSVELLQTINVAATTAMNLTGNQVGNSIARQCRRQRHQRWWQAMTRSRANPARTRSPAGPATISSCSIAALNASTNVDTVTDYSVAADTVRSGKCDLHRPDRPAAHITADQFHIGAAAADAEDRIIYNAATGAVLLRFAMAQVRQVAAIQFAKLATGLALTNADFVVV